MMKNYDQSVKINHNPKWPYIPDHPYRILIVWGSGWTKTNVSLNLMKYQPGIDQIYLYVKYIFESKHQLLMDWREKVGSKTLKNPNHWLFTNNGNLSLFHWSVFLSNRQSFEYAALCL